MKKLPMVSIVIPVYNGDNYMKEAIDSALEQTYKNIEIIVVNDGSNDDGKTDEIAKSYGNKIRYYCKENGGVSTALNLAIKKMKGDFFSWLSHDDVYYPDKIETQINYLLKNNLLNEKVITYSNYDVINEKSQITNTVHFQVYCPNDYPEYALLRGLISGTALLIPKTAFKEYGVFDESYRCVQDYLLFYEFMKTYRYIFIPKVTNATRVHSKQVTCVNSKVITENNMLWIKMQNELPVEAKIRLEGSEYKFYKEMYRFLINHNNYTEAQDFALTQSNKLLKKEYNKFKMILEETDGKKLLSYLCENCEKAGINIPLEFSEKLINSNFTIDDKNQIKVNKIIKNIGIQNMIEYILNNNVYENKKSLLKKYESLYNSITTQNNTETIVKLSKISRLLSSLKTHGVVKTMKKIKNKIVNRKSSSNYY